MADIDLKRINGNDLSWGSCVIKIAGARIRGIEEIDFGDKRVRELVYGMDRAQAPRGVTSGEYQPDEGRMLVPKSSAYYVRKNLADAIGSTSYGDAMFNVDIDSRERESNAPATNVELLECHIVGEKESKKRGSAVLMVEFTIQYKFILRDGLHLWSAGED